MARKALLIRPDLCIGCRACQVACKAWKLLPAEKTINRGTHENPPDLSAMTYNKIKFIEISKHNGEVKWFFVSERCKHCGEPMCVTVCPVRALQKDSTTGIVFYDKEKCIGCRACSYACPYNIPRYEEKNNKIAKCDLCIDRVKEGLEPACAKACPTEAIKYGDRDELLRIAKKEYRYIYGEKEYKGLGVLYALNEPPSVYQLKEAKIVSKDILALGEFLRSLVDRGVPIDSSVVQKFFANKTSFLNT